MLALPELLLKGHEPASPSMQPVKPKRTLVSTPLHPGLVLLR